jgi:hypothetical protein
MNPVARIGLILAYAILGLAATGRSVVQIGTKFSEAPLPYGLSGASAVIYVVIAITLWRGAHGVALVGTAVELVGVVVVGAWGYVQPELWPAHTVWSGFGSGYGWVPLVLPVVALTLLMRERRDLRGASQYL